ncbi:MAG: tetratricopeptide repeat protein, partial [Verrucomicrobiaceae bacterium]
MAKLPEVPVAHLEFEHSPLEDAVMRHKNKLILVSVLAVVGTLGYFGNKLWVEHQQSVAALAFTRADTVGELREVAAQNPGQPGGGSALLDASRLLAKEGKNKEAMEELQKFISNYSSHELIDLAKFRLADLKLQEGSLQEAAAGFQEIAKNPASPYASLALIRAGDIHWQEGKTEEARRLFEEAVTKTGGNQVAMQRLKQVKLVAPTLIDYVPEPAPAAPAPGSPPSIDALNGAINAPGLMGDDPTGLGGEAPLLPPPALPGLPPSIKVTPPAPAAPPVPDPVPATPAPRAGWEQPDQQRVPAWRERDPEQA